MHGGRNTTFFYDDWNFVTMRIGWRPYILLYPHNEHLSLLPVLVYKILFETVGLNHYGAFRAVSVCFNLACGLLFFLYVRKRIGDLLALGLTACLVLMGAAAYDLIWPFQIGYLGSLATGLGALLALDLRSRRGDIAACVLTAASLSSSSVGLAVVVAVALDVLLRPARLRRSWVFGIPALLYALWYLKYGVATGDLAAITHVPAEIWGGLTGSITALLGLPGDYGGPLAVALIAAVVVEIGRRDLNLRVIAVMALPVVFWALAAIARTSLPPTEPRYLYPTGLFVALIAADALWRVRPAPRSSWLLGAILGLCALGSAAGINTFADSWRGFAFTTKTSLTAADVLGPRVVGPQVLPDPNQPQLFYGRYRSAVEAYGSTPAWSATELRQHSEGDRDAVDAALVRLVGPVLTSGERPGASGCTTTGGSRVLALPGRRLYVAATTAPVELRYRRFGTTFPQDAQSTVQPHQAGYISFPTDTAADSWFISAQSSVPFTTCTPA